jgi:hypothetical protein
MQVGGCGALIHDRVEQAFPRHRFESSMSRETARPSRRSSPIAVAFPPIFSSRKLGALPSPPRTPSVSPVLLRARRLDVEHNGIIREHAETGRPAAEPASTRLSGDGFVVTGRAHVRAHKH